MNLLLFSHQLLPTILKTFFFFLDKEVIEIISNNPVSVSLECKIIDDHDFVKAKQNETDFVLQRYTVSPQSIIYL